jgi:hypothetical protein
MWTDGIDKLIVAFHSFANEPKNTLEPGKPQMANTAHAHCMLDK